MKKRFILFIGVYDTLDLFMLDFQRTYKELGYETMLFDTNNFSNSLLQLSTFAAQPVDAMITFNNLGLNFEFEAGKNLWNDLKIPCINILVDHPFHYHDALLQVPEECIVLCMDKNHVAYVKRFYPNVKASYFIAHGGNISPEVCSWKDREIDVLYAGGLSKDFIAPLIPVSEEVGELDVETVANDVLSVLISQPSDTTEMVLEQYFLKKGFYIPDEMLRYLISKFRFIDSLAVSHFREKSVAMLVKNGVKVHLYGNGWQNCPWIDEPNVVYGQRITPEGIFRLMGHSKIVLNTMTWFKDGTHDRVFNAMLSGGVAVTDSSKYLTDNFCSGKELVSFELKQIDTLPDLAAYYLAHPEESIEITSRAFDAARTEHTWGKRAVQIMQYLDEYLEYGRNV